MVARAPTTRRITRYGWKPGAEVVEATASAGLARSGAGVFEDGSVMLPPLAEADPSDPAAMLWAGG